MLHYFRFHIRMWFWLIALIQWTKVEIAIWKMNVLKMARFNLNLIFLFQRVIQPTSILAFYLIAYIA